ncbi:MAG: cadherin-like domain-containing protein [Moraxellaceae bacterium]|nr:cadherin-like domain-containing protein [Moraxellaceae bacterium]
MMPLSCPLEPHRVLTAGTEDTAYTINASDLLQGFSDIDSPSLSVINLSSSSGLLQDNQDGTYTLTPNTNFNGLIQLDYQVDDSNGGVVDATSSVFITAVNDAPVAPSNPISLTAGLKIPLTPFKPVIYYKALVMLIVIA